MSIRMATINGLVVLTNVPDRTAAERLARDLVERRLAACVNLLAPCQSFYRWEGAVQQDEEYPLLIKTTRMRYAALEAAIREGHPADVPEIIAMPIEFGLAAYLEWVGRETTP
jgi:periplasmic divalent cation tolerance protein